MVKRRKSKLQVDQAQRKGVARTKSPLKIPTPSRPSPKKEGGKNKESTDMIEGGGDDGFVNGNGNAVFFFFFFFSFFFLNFCIKKSGRGL